MIELNIGMPLDGKNPAMCSIMGRGTAQQNLSAALLVAGQSFPDNPDVRVMIMQIAILGLILLMVVVITTIKRIV